MPIIIRSFSFHADVLQASHFLGRSWKLAYFLLDSVSNLSIGLVTKI